MSASPKSIFAAQYRGLKPFSGSGRSTAAPARINASASAGSPRPTATLSGDSESMPNRTTFAFTFAPFACDSCSR